MRADQGRAARRARPCSASPTSPSACRRRRARWSTRSSSTTPPRPGSTSPSSTPRSSSASPRSRSEAERRRRPAVEPVAARAAGRSGRARAAAGRRPTGGQSLAQRKRINQFAIARLQARFRGVKRARRSHRDELPLDRAARARRSSRARATGSRRPRAEARAGGGRPLDIINGPLMAGMAEVGRLFNANELIVAEVLQSAEAMKAAVGLLEPFMDAAESGAARHGRARHGQGRRPRHRQEPGRDHPLEQRLQGRQPGHQGAARSADRGRGSRASPDAVGLSGLLVKSAQQMVVTAEDLAAGGIDLPLLVGGAAPCPRRFTARSIAPAYGGPVSTPRTR